MVSVNDCVEYYSPTGDAGDDYVLRTGDVVKMYVPQDRPGLLSWIVDRAL